MMTSVVGCALSDRVAAIAPVSGIILPDRCEPDHPMPVLAFHGTADPFLLLNGGCDDTPDDEQVSDEVIRRTFDCPDDAPVEFLIVDGGGHSWPGSEFSRTIERIVGPTTFDIDASEEIWRYFQRFSLSEPPR
jgi:polyhydroxybutyrate depolymerase